MYFTNGKFVLNWDMDMNIGSPTFGQRYMGTVVAWMPMPEPYMEGSNETTLPNKEKIISTWYRNIRMRIRI